MTDIHSLVGAYAIDALEDLERAAFERHLAECPACQSEVAGLREAGAIIGSSVAIEPPAGLRTKVLADIATVRPLPPAVDRPAVAPGGRRRFRPAALVAAAAAVIALGAGVAAVTQPWQDESSRSVTVADQIRSAEDAETFTRTLDGGAQATLTRSQSMNRAVLVTSDMPDAPSGSVYELWLLHDGEMVSAGLMPRGAHEILLEGDPATAQGFGITVEPDGGSDEPTSEPIALIEFQQA